MKKVKLIFAAIAIFASFTCIAQSEAFKKGQVDLNAGIGFITPLFNNNTKNSFQTATPPVSVTIDLGITDEVSLGIYAGYTSSAVYGTLTDPYSGSTSYGLQSTISHKIIGGRLLYHTSLGSKIDLYGGGMLGYNYVEEIAEPNILLYGQTKEQALTYSVLAGARVRFAKFAGIFLEAGYGVTIISTGLNIKF